MVEWRAAPTTASFPRTRESSSGPQARRMWHLPQDGFPRAREWRRGGGVRCRLTQHGIPAFAGMTPWWGERGASRRWIPACAGMTPWWGRAQWTPHEGFPRERRCGRGLCRGV